jgi:hypothetical protein
MQKEAIINIALNGSNNTNIQEYRKTVKERAMQAAQEKADYLLASVNARRGRLERITEQNGPQSTLTRHNGYYGSWNYRTTTSHLNMGPTNATVATPNSGNLWNNGKGDEAGLKPIRLQYAIEATFRIAG